jgi:hypothetical protein
VLTAVDARIKHVDGVSQDPFIEFDRVGANVAGRRHGLGNE